MRSLSAACLMIALWLLDASMNETTAETSNIPDSLTVARLVGSPSLDGVSLSGVKLSPDGQRITFLKGKEGNFRQQDLWEFNVADRTTRLLVDSDVLLGGRQEQLSEEEKARRERQRIRGTGIIEYYWNDSGSALLFPLNGDLYYLPIGGDPTRLTQSEAFETDVKVSPKGTYVSFIRERELYVVEIATGRETRLTRGASDTIANGVAEFIAQEELDRDTGYWWAPDESAIAFTRTDESPVGILNRYELNADGSVTTRQQRYPAAGTDNVLIQLGVVRVSDGQTHWVDLGDDADIYLARVNWLTDSSGLIVQRLPRDQQSLDLLRVDADGGNPALLVREQTEVWINLHHNLKTLQSTSDFLWTSERSGFSHIYRVSADGNSVTPLTSGEWVVSEISHVDEERGWVYFTGFRDSTLEKHLYRVRLKPDPSSVEKISREAGWHEVEMGGSGEVFLDRFSAPRIPPQLSVRNADTGELIDYVVENPLNRSHPYFAYLGGHAPSEFGQLEAADGETPLDYQLILPPEMEPGRRYPAILAPYGGPHGHRVRRDWSMDFNQVLARNGFVVLVVDNRGSYNRGVAFEAPIKNAMGGVEVDDQVAAGRFLQELPYVDPERIGFHGWSYGGYMALLMLFKAPELIKVGISGAPVTDWRLYDTGYTERYLGMPDAPGEVYDKSSVFRYVDGLQGKLLLIHGMADDNVFFDNSVKLMGLLQAKGAEFDLMTYPGQKHGFRTEPIRRHLYELMLGYFQEHL